MDPETCFLYCFIIHLGQWLGIKEEKETSKLLRFSHWYSFWSKFLFCPFLPSQARNLFCLDLRSNLGEKNRIDGNSLKHGIVFIPRLEKLQGKFCLSNFFDASLNANRIPKLLGTFPLISYPGTDFITIISELPGSWQPLPTKLLNNLAGDCCSTVCLQAERGGAGCRRERLSIASPCPRWFCTTQLRGPFALVLWGLPVASHNHYSPAAAEPSYTQCFSHLPFPFFWKLLKSSIIIYKYAKDAHKARVIVVA